LAVAPDGRSLISSVGVHKSSVWIHDAAGDHPVSAEGSASWPKISADGKRVYYLLRKNALSQNELWSTERATGKSNPSLPGVSMIDFDLSPDGQQTAFTVQSGREVQIFLAPLDGSAPPRLVVRGGDTVSFGAPGELVFRQVGAQANYLARIKTDGTGLQRLMDQPILDKAGVSPDGAWAVAAGVSGSEVPIVAVSPKDRTRRFVCSFCRPVWSPDGAFLYVMTGFYPSAGSTTLVLPIPRGEGLPVLPAAGLDPNSMEETPGVRVIRQGWIAPGPDPETYAFVKLEFEGNLFRIPLH